LAACGGADRDGDGYGGDADCDDDAAEVNPEAAEVCDGIDNDCDDDIDGPTSDDALVWYVDADGDGAGDSDRFAKACAQPTGWVAAGGDCDDDDASVQTGCG
jgi:hypothetical protein